MSLPQWNRILLYGLFGFSTFSIAGTEAMVGLLYIVSMIRAYKSPGTFQWKSTAFLLALGWLSLILLTHFFSPYSVHLREVLGNTWRLFLPFVLYVSFDDVDLSSLLSVFLSFLILISLYGVIQHYTGADWLRSAERQSPTPYKHPCYSVHGVTSFFHAKGNYTHHLTYGGVLLLSMPIYLSLIWSKGLSQRIRCFYILGVMFMFAGILASLARSIWLSSLVVIVILALRLPRKFLISLMVAVVILVSGLLTHYTFQDHTLDKPVSGVGLIWQRLESGFVLKYNKDRLLMWESALAAIRDHLWTGIGMANDRDVMPQYREPLSQKHDHEFFNSAAAGVHNIYLQLLIHTGVLGLLAYLGAAFWILSQNIRVLFRVSEKLAFYPSILWGTTAGLVAFMTAGFFENNFYDAEVQALLVMVLGLNFYAIKQIRKA